MAIVKKPLRMVIKGAEATVYVQMEDGETYEIYIGGQCETWFDHKHNKLKAHVRRPIKR